MIVSAEERYFLQSTSTVDAIWNGSRLKAGMTSVRDGLYAFNRAACMAGHVYIMASKKDGTLYVGVTSDLSGRVYEHKESLTPGFSSRYGCRRLVWYEEHFDIRDAIAREKTIKRWPRKWKIELIEAMNPHWNEFYRGMGW